MRRSCDRLAKAKGNLCSTEEPQKTRLLKKLTETSSLSFEFLCFESNRNSVSETTNGRESLSAVASRTDSEFPARLIYILRSRNLR